MTVLLTLAVVVLWTWVLWSHHRDRRRAAELIQAADDAIDAASDEERERIMRLATGMPAEHPESLTTPLDDEDEDALAEIVTHYGEEPR